jgi:hypothetical protein
MHPFAMQMVRVPPCLEEMLSKHYGFPSEEADFIINFDIKYRLGRNEDGDEDE